MTSVAIVGPGRMGLALAHALQRSGELTEVTIYGRRPEAPSHPVFQEIETRYVFGLEPLRGDCMAVFLAVPDDLLLDMAHQVAAQGPAPGGCAAFHLSGALPTDVLAPLHAAGYQVGAFHPWIVAGRSVSTADRLRGACIGVTASPEATRKARDLASVMGANVVTIPANRRAITDAAVVMVAAFLPTLLDSASSLLDRAGVDADEALQALAPLVRSVLDEIEATGVADTLGSVLERSDAEAIGVHLRTLEGDERKLYAWVGREAARRAGAALDPDERGALVAHFEPVPGE
jgi:predicted short-subunit dehydrogenase-like oxidoreductase (DUF2520 family)